MEVINDLEEGMALREGFECQPDARRKYSAHPLGGLNQTLLQP